jgi:hypothetical protein
MYASDVIEITLFVPMCDEASYAYRHVTIGVCVHDSTISRAETPYTFSAEDTDMPHK